jgi:hypothetical protein
MTWLGKAEVKANAMWSHDIDGTMSLVIVFDKSDPEVEELEGANGTAKFRSAVVELRSDRLQVTFGNQINERKEKQ